MSDRSLKVIGGLCAGAAALALSLAALVGMLVGSIQNGLEEAYGTAFSAITGSGSHVAAAINGYHTFVAVCVLAAVTTLAGMGACVVLLRRRKRRGN